jgi:hypothetical protein
MNTCPHCGAEIEGGPTCPRCGSSLPANRSAKALAFASRIIGAACGLGAGIQLLIDYAQNGAFGWSLIGVASSALAWLLIGLPMLSYRRPAIFLPAMAASAMVYLWILESITGGEWFLRLALPIALAVALAGTITAALCLKAKRRGPNIASYIIFGCVIVCVAVENILSFRFGGSWSFSWSAIVAVSGLPVSILLLGIQSRIRPAT